MTWKRSEEQLAFEATLVALFSCGIENCAMKPFEAPAGKGAERMRRHRKKEHPQLRESKRRRKSRLFPRQEAFD